jgi:hypothetical protein
MQAQYNALAKARGKLRKRHRWTYVDYTAEKAVYEANKARIMAQENPSQEDIQFLAGWERVLAIVEVKAELLL